MRTMAQRSAHAVLKIGLTGGVASGKSTVARMFEALGAAVIDTDVIAPGSAADFYGLDAEAERVLLVDRAFRALDPA